MNIIRLLRQNSPSFLAGAIGAGVVSGLSLTFLIQMIHRTINSESPDFVRFLGFYMVVWFAFLVCTTIATLMTTKLAHKALYELREWVTDHILKVTYRVTEGKASEFFPILTEDIQTISHIIYRIPGVMTGAATIVGCVVYMFYLSWIISLIILSVFVVIYLVMTLFGKRAQSYARSARTQYDRIYHFFEDLVYGLKELKLNPALRNHYRNTLFPPLIQKHQGFKLRENVLFNFSIRSVEILFFPAIGALVYAIFTYGISTTEAFNGVIMVLLFLLSPLSTIANFVSDYKTMQVSLQRVNNLEQQIGQNLEIKHDQVDLPDGDAKAPILELADISLRYVRDDGTENFVMGPLNVSIPTNKITFVIGDNGSGKSTMAKVITGLYMPDAGELKYRGVPVEPKYISSYRARFSSVFSDFHLFRELPPEAFDVGMLPEWIKLMELQKYVEIDGNRLNVGKLSQGQQERLAFAVACAFPSEIMVLDEVASNQDSDFRRKIYLEILPKLRDMGRTIIVISHDEAYFDRADHTILFREGNVVQYGSGEKE